MEKENVYEETTRAEETTAVSKDGAGRKDAEKNASTVPGKFKDVDALARAYGSLQAEFTRRSQRLKELEKMVENFEKDELDAVRSGAEKLRKNAKTRKAEAKRFDEFVATTMEVNAQEAEENGLETKPVMFVDKPSDETPSSAGTEENGDPMYEMNALAECGEPAKKGEGTGEMKEPAQTGHPKGEETQRSVATSGNAADSSENLYEQVSRDETVRLKIIGEYLSSLGKSGAPLMTGGRGVLATPPIKPKSISDAGDMALLYFKKSKA